MVIFERSIFVAFILYTIIGRVFLQSAVFDFFTLYDDDFYPDFSNFSSALGTVFYSNLITDVNFSIYHTNQKQVNNEYFSKITFTIYYFFSNFTILINYFHGLKAGSLIYYLRTNTLSKIKKL